MFKKRFSDFKAKDFMYKRKGPWPQPNPEHPLGEAPAVLHLPLSEWVDWWLHIGSRFAGTIAYSPIAYLSGILNSKPDLLTDDEFMELFENSMMSKFICDTLDEKDSEIFKDYLDTDDNLFILDFEIAKVVKPFPGMYVTGTKCLLRKLPESEGKYKFAPIAIYIDSNKEIIEPTDGAAWDLAKLYVIQGSALGITLVVHSILHFPLDSINAISKSSLPKGHILYKLIIPHTRFTLALENAVLTFKSTVINPTFWKTYSPHPGPREGLRDLLVEGFKGIEGNASYKTFKYPKRPEKIYSYFGEFRDAYFDVFHNFVEKVLGDYDVAGDPIIIQWAKYCSQNVPGFPDDKEIVKPGVLVSAVAYYLWSVSVGHAVDHETYNNIPVRKKTMRIRVKPPTKDLKSFNINDVCKYWDVGKYIMAQVLFFKAWTVDYLVNIDYKFDDSKDIEAQKVFFRELHELDEQMQKDGTCFMKLKDMPSSIQY